MTPSPQERAAGQGAVARARAALASRDFRLLLGARLSSQFADGVFQAFLVDKLVFLAPEHQSTAAGVAKAFALLVVPFSLVGPLTGVVIDRWSRRRILALTPLLRCLAVLALLPLATGHAGAALYALTLVVVSANRFYLATAGAVMPSLVPPQDLLVANSLASAAGTVVTFGGLVAATQVADATGLQALLAVPAVAWPLSALAAWAIRAPLQPLTPPPPVAGELARVARELVSGARRLAATPPALGSIVAVSVDQFLVGLITVLGAVVFREEFRETVASFGRFVGAGGVGVLVGTLTVGFLEDRMDKRRIVTLAFALAGLVCLGSSVRIADPTIVLISFTLGLTYPWRKVPADTIVQESVPDRYRGRVFALYDLLFSLPRVLSAAVAVPLVPALSTGWIVALCALVYLLWAPVFPWWVSRARWVGVRFHEGARAQEWPRALRIGGEEEPVEVLRSWTEERAGVRLRRFRLRLQDGTQADLVGEEGSGRWRLERELPPPGREPLAREAPPP
ncbi:MAG TPA: MFS transporter [Actinomycetota bacterium]|nr:MFS transporter [Actinomycetota bacterium]